VLGNVFYANGITASKIYNGTSEANVGTSGGNANISIGGTSNVVVFASTGEYVSGLLSVTGNTTSGNLLTGGLISATGNVTGNKIVVGSGNVTSPGIAFLSDASQDSGFYWAGEGNIGVTVNGNTQAFFNTNGLTISGNLTVGNISTSGLLVTTLSATGNINGANIVALANIIGGNITTVGLISSTGTVTGGNLATGGTVSATSTITSGANITGGNVLTGGLISSTGTITSGSNITGGNVLTNGLISAAGNITGNYVLGNVFYANGITASKIYNGTSEANVGTSGGNANISIGGTSNVAVFASTGVYFNGNLVPAASNAYSLGSSTNRWANLWLTGNTIYLGNSIITSAENGDVIIDNSGSFAVPVGTTAQRSEIQGAIRYNTTAGAFETYDGVGWNTLAYGTATDFPFGDYGSVSDIATTDAFGISIASTFDCNAEGPYSYTDLATGEAWVGA
jgi:hypothetical protein